MFVPQAFPAVPRSGGPAGFARTEPARIPYRRHDRRRGQTRWTGTYATAGLTRHWYMPRLADCRQRTRQRILRLRCVVSVAFSVVARVASLPAVIPAFLDRCERRGVKGAILSIGKKPGPAIETDYLQRRCDLLGATAEPIMAGSKTNVLCGFIQQPHARILGIGCKKQIGEPLLLEFYATNPVDHRLCQPFETSPMPQMDRSLPKHLRQRTNDAAGRRLDTLTEATRAEQFVTGWIARIR